AKINLWSQFRQKPAAIAIRGIVKAPTGKKDEGISTGKADVAADFIVSREANALELSGYAGYEFRGKPDGFDAPNGAFRWGAGAGFASRSPLRGTFELTGILPTKDTITITSAHLVGDDGSLPPTVSETENLTRATAGLTWQHRNGFFVGGGVSWNVPME